LKKSIIPRSLPNITSLQMNYNEHKPSCWLKPRLPNISLSPSTSSSISMSPTFMSYTNASTSSSHNCTESQSSSGEEKTFRSVKFVNLCNTPTGGNYISTAVAAAKYNKLASRSSFQHKYDPYRYEDSTLKHFASTLSVNLSQYGDSSISGRSAIVYNDRRSASKMSRRVEGFSDLLSTKSSSSSTIRDLKQSKC
jgi:hypothetical protein